MHLYKLISNDKRVTSLCRGGLNIENDKERSSNGKTGSIGYNSGMVCCRDDSNLGSSVGNGRLGDQQHGKGAR